MCKGEVHIFSVISKALVDLLHQLYKIQSPVLLSVCVCSFPLKDQYGPRIFFLEFPFFAKNMIIKSILNLWWHSKILKLFLGVVRGIFTKRLKRTRRLLYTVKYDFFQMTALHSKC